MGIQLPFERNTAYLSGFSSVRNITFVENSSIEVNERTTVSLLRKPSMLEEGGANTMFPCES
jgi:hypothetical protein